MLGSVLRLFPVGTCPPLAQTRPFWQLRSSYTPQLHDNYTTTTPTFITPQPHPPSASWHHPHRCPSLHEQQPRRRRRESKGAQLIGRAAGGAAVTGNIAALSAEKGWTPSPAVARPTSASCTNSPLSMDGGSLSPSCGDEGSGDSRWNSMVMVGISWSV